MTALLSLGSAIGAGFAAVIAFLAARMTAKVGLVAGAVVSIAALTAGLIVALEAISSSLSATLPPDVLAFAGAILPGNLNACISAVAAASFARWIYDRHVQIVEMFTNG